MSSSGGPWDCIIGYHARVALEAEDDLRVLIEGLGNVHLRHQPLSLLQCVFEGFGVQHGRVFLTEPAEGHTNALPENTKWQYLFLSNLKAGVQSL